MKVKTERWDDNTAGEGGTLNFRQVMRRGLAAAVAVALLLFLGLAGKIFENVDADEIVVIQDPLDGELNWYTTPGIKTQNFGKVTTYLKRSIYEFRKQLRFNDGAHGTMVGSIQYEMPTDTENLTAIHVRFGSRDAVQRQLIQTVVDKATYMTGPLMSSKESYAEKRNALIWFIEDQTAHGVYRTKQREERTADPITGVEKTITIVEIVEGRDGKPERQEQAVLGEFGIKPFNFSITELTYDPKVEEQIATQQQATMDVQTAMAEAKKAEQRALTAVKEGEANAAKSKWEQEVLKARAVTLAQQEKEVAETSAAKEYQVAKIGAERELEVQRLAALAAEQYKRQQILKAEGDADYKRKVMEADGALTPKLETYKAVQALYADAIKSYQGNWVPSVVMGGTNGAQTASGATQLIDLLAVKTARDLGLDMSIRSGRQTKQD